MAKITVIDIKKIKTFYFSRPPQPSPSGGETELGKVINILERLSAVGVDVSTLSKLIDKLLTLL